MYPRLKRLGAGFLLALGACDGNELELAHGARDIDASITDAMADISDASDAGDPMDASVRDVIDASDASDASAVVDVLDATLRDAGDASDASTFSACGLDQAYTFEAVFPGDTGPNRVRKSYTFSKEGLLTETDTLATGARLAPSDRVLFKCSTQISCDDPRGDIVDIRGFLMDPLVQAAFSDETQRYGEADSFLPVRYVEREDGKSLELGQLCRGGSCGATFSALQKLNDMWGAILTVNPLGEQPNGTLAGDCTR